MKYLLLPFFVFFAIGCMDSKEEKRDYLEGYDSIVDHYEWDNEENDWTLTFTRYLKLDLYGNIQESMQENHNKNTISNLVRYEYERDESDLLLQSISYIDDDSGMPAPRNKTEYVSYENEEVVLLNQYKWDVETENWVKEVEIEYSYLEDSKIEYINLNNIETGFIIKYQYTYNNDGSVDVINILDEDENIFNRVLFTFKNGARYQTINQKKDNEIWINDYKEIYVK